MNEIIKEIPQKTAADLSSIQRFIVAGLLVESAALQVINANCAPQDGQLAPESEAPADGENAQEVGENDDLEAGSIPVITPSPTSEATTNANSSEIIELTVIKPSLSDFPEHDSWQSLVDEIGAGFSSDSEVIERLGLQEGDTVVSQVGVLVFEDGNKNHQYLAFISTQDSEGKRVEFVTRYFDDLTSNFSELELESSSQGLQWVTEIDSERGGVITVDLETGNITGPYEINLGNIFDDFSESKAVNGGIGVLASFSKIEVENAQTLKDAKATLAKDGVKLALGKNGWLIIDQRGDTTILLFEEVDGVLKKAAEGVELSPEAAELLDAVGEQIDEAEAPTDGAAAIEEAEQGVVAEAMNDYGMPEAQAQKLAGLDVRFERVTDYVPDGVRVLDSEGTEVFYYDGQTEFLVAVDRWERITDIERIWENEMTREEVFSDEYFAWLKWVGSTLEWDVPKIEANIEQKIPQIVAKGFLTQEEADEWLAKRAFPMIVLSDGFIVPEVSTAPNFTDPATNPVKRSEAFAFVHDPALTDKYPWFKGGFDTYAIFPNFMLSFDPEQGEYRVYPVIANLLTADEVLKQSVLPKYQDNMNVTPILIDIDSIVANPEDNFEAASFERFGEEKMKAAFRALADGDPSLLSKPGLVVEIKTPNNFRYR